MYIFRCRHRCSNFFLVALTLKGLFLRVDLGQDEPESGDLMSGNTKGVTLGKDFISVHQIHFDEAVMGTVQMSFGCNPVQECMSHHCAKAKSSTAAEIKQTEGVCRC